MERETTRKTYEFGFAVWCGLLLGLAIGIIGSLAGWHQGTLPPWTDPFYSGWAQTIGALVAIFAAFRIGQTQVKAASLERARDRADEYRLALHIAYSVLSDVTSTIELLVNVPTTRHRGMRPAVMRVFETASTDLRAVLRMNIAVRIRMPVKQALMRLDKRLEIHRLFSNSFEALELTDLPDDLGEFKVHWDSLGKAMLEAEQVDQALGIITIQ